MRRFLALALLAALLGGCAGTQLGEIAEPGPVYVSPWDTGETD